MSASLGELQKQLLGRGLGDYQRALLELLCGAIKGDDVRVGGAIEASVKAWPRYFKSNRWRIDWFLALDTIAFFNLTRTLIDAPIATLKHERWRTPPPMSTGPGKPLLDFSVRLPVIDKWWRASPALADPSEWG